MLPMPCLSTLFPFFTVIGLDRFENTFVAEGNSCFSPLAHKVVMYGYYRMIMLIVRQTCSAGHSCS